ncbi:hypothetical protein ACQCVM_22780 [Rossellomorea aquimaris]
MTGLQTAIIVSALPLTFVVLVMCYGLVKQLRNEYDFQMNHWTTNEKDKSKVGLRKLPFPYKGFHFWREYLKSHLN